ncbi:MAG: hypothetical protein JWR12_884 [Mucilaginibacter sp.]|nr:hypothetical protein [Mucilaginibacter sp.]
MNLIKVENIFGGKIPDNKSAALYQQRVTQKINNKASITHQIIYILVT